MPMLPAESVQTPEARARLLEALMSHARQHQIAVERSDEADRYGGGVYRRSENKILLSKSLQPTDSGISNLAHELGHAELDETTLGQIIQNPLMRSAAYAAPAMGAIIAIAAKGNFARRAALSAGAAAAMQLPMLGSEMLADHRGRQMLIANGASPEMLAAHRQASVGGVTSYLRPGAKAVGISLLIAAMAHAMAASS